MLCFSLLKQHLKTAAQECMGHLSRISQVGGAETARNCADSLRTNFRPIRGGLIGSWRCLRREGQILSIFVGHTAVVAMDCACHFSDREIEHFTKRELNNRCYGSVQHWLNPVNGIYTRLLDCVDREWDGALSMAGQGSKEIRMGIHKDFRKPLYNKLARYEPFYLKAIVPIARFLFPEPGKSLMSKVGRAAHCMLFGMPFP